MRALAIAPADIEGMEVRSPVPTANTLYDVAAVGNGTTAIAVGLNGAAVKTANGGRSWSAIDRLIRGASVEDMFACASNGTRVVAVGSSPAVTSDLQSWEWGAFAGGFRLDVAFGNGNFVATGRASNVEVSSDGLNWSKIELPTGTQNLEVIAFGNGVFVAAGANGRILRSANGTSWEIARAGAGTDGWFRSMVFANGRFLTTGDNGLYHSSADGQSWEETEPAMPFISDTTGMHFLNGRFVTVGNNGGVASSTDGGRSWTAHATGIDTRLTDIAYQNGQYVAVGFSPDVYTSPDLEVWQVRATGFATSSISQIEGAKGQFMIFGPTSTSPNGTDWTPFTPPGAVRFGTTGIAPELGVYSLLDSRLFANAPGAGLEEPEDLDE